MTRACSHHQQYVGGDRVQCEKYTQPVNVTLCGQCDLFELAPMPTKRKKRKRPARIGDVMSYLLSPISGGCGKCGQSAKSLNRMTVSEVWRDRKRISGEIVGRVSSRPDLIRWAAIRWIVANFPGVAKAAVVALLLTAGVIAKVARPKAQQSNPARMK